MRAELKFCGLTRAADARAAAMCGAQYVGVIFAGGPRNMDPAAAAAGARWRRRATVAARRRLPRRGHCRRSRASSRTARLDIVQLHGDPTRARGAGACAKRPVRACGPCCGSAAPRRADRVDELDGEADALLYDTLVPGRLGGTGRARSIGTGGRRRAPERGRASSSPADSRPRTSAHAIAALAPDIVDVSSGVESSPGIKDHERMRVFADAVRGTRGQ